MAEAPVNRAFVLSRAGNKTNDGFLRNGQIFKTET